MPKPIKLDEAAIRNIVTESIKKILSEEELKPITHGTYDDEEHDTFSGIGERVAYDAFKELKKYKDELNDSVIEKVIEGFGIGLKSLYKDGGVERYGLQIA